MLFFKIKKRKTYLKFSTHPISICLKSFTHQIPQSNSKFEEYLINTSGDSVWDQVEMSSKEEL